MRLLEGLGPSVLVFKVCCVRICSVEMLSKNEYVISIQIYMINDELGIFSCRKNQRTSY